MARTYTFSVDNVGNPEPVTAQGPCRKIIVREQGAAATTDYFVRQPTNTSPQVRKVSGESTLFDTGEGNLFQTGQIVGYVETVSGTVTFSQEEME